MGLIKGVAPYWRLALQHQMDNSYLFVGTFGLFSNMLPIGYEGTPDKFTDIGVDAQYELTLGSSTFSAHATYIHENQVLDATFKAGGSQNSSNNLNTFKIFGSMYFLNKLNVSLGYFNTTGSKDSLLFSPSVLTGSMTNKPDSDGLIAELAYLPWYNTRFSLQYVFYNKFNGSSSNYDGFNRDASHNNTIYLLAWIVF
jgi:hypothetical protein